jgi:hypothetical protein
MAIGTIGVLVKIDHANGARKQPFAPAKLVISQTENRGIDSVQNFGTGAANISFGLMTSLPLFVCFQNLDSTNYVEIGVVVSAVFVPVMVIQPGMLAGPITPAAGTTWQARAHTAACDVRVCAYAG